MFMAVIDELDTVSHERILRAYGLLGGHAYAEQLIEQEHKVSGSGFASTSHFQYVGFLMLAPGLVD